MYQYLCHFSPQMQEECIGDTVTNIYKPQWTLLASCKLRLAHTLSLLLAQTPDPSQRVEYRCLAQRACEEGMEAARSSAFVDPCLVAELKFHYGESTCAPVSILHV